MHANSLAHILMTEGPNASIEDRSSRDALIVPETKPLDDLLADLQRHRSSMAVVIERLGLRHDEGVLDEVLYRGVWGPRS